MHSAILIRLQQFENDAKNTNNPRLFLTELGPLHNSWHRNSAVRRRIGFLIFHWHVIEHFETLGLKQILNVKPYSISDFSQGGKFASADWNSAMSTAPQSKSIQDLESYSAQIEAWHGDAHMEIGMAENIPMMDPLVNINFTQFWNLHYFINAKFKDELQSYIKAAHPGLNLSTASKIIEHLEGKGHHRSVPLI